MLGGGGKLSKLTLKQKRFADEYIISANATAAAIKAGYSKKTARSIGQENLTKPDIKAYIDERLENLNLKRLLRKKKSYNISLQLCEETNKKRRSLALESLARR